MYGKYDNINNRSGSARACKKKKRRISQGMFYRRNNRDRISSRSGGVNVRVFCGAFKIFSKICTFFKKFRKLLIFIVIIVLFWRTLMAMESVIGVSLENAAEIKMREYVENVVIHSVHKVLESSEDEYGDREHGVITPVMNNDGGVSMVTLNTDAVNRIGSEIAMEVNSDIHDGVAQTIRVSIGTMLRSKLLSQVTPAVKFDIMPVSVSEIGYKTEFEDAGINQTKYKVYIVINTEARVMAPFMAENIHVENTVLAAESVIVGGVPDTYANIPADNISDFVS